MSWRLARSLDELRQEINDLFPSRSKISDGTIGDQAHRARVSDHNPNAAGVVTALDITEDAERGVPEIVDAIFDQIIERRDRRVKYLIHEGRICRSYDKPGIPAWTWAPYDGDNAHTVHGHISVVTDPALYDSTRPWGIHLPTRGTVNITAFHQAKTRDERRKAAARVALHGSRKARTAARAWLKADTALRKAAAALLREEVVA